MATFPCKSGTSLSVKAGFAGQLCKKASSILGNGMAVSHHATTTQTNYKHASNEQAHTGATGSYGAAREEEEKTWEMHMAFQLQTLPRFRIESDDFAHSGSDHDARDLSD